MDQPINFHCKICGVEVPIAPNPPELAVCEDHCEDHEYVHDPMRRGRFCTHCDKQMEEVDTF